MNARKSFRSCLSLLALAAVFSARPAIAQTAVTEVPQIPQPKIPDKTFNVMDYGVVADGKTLDTEAFQKAIDTVGKAGGGTLTVPPGTYLLSPITLVSNLDLNVQKGATLLFTNDWKKFGDGGKFANCIQANDVHDLAITGGGIIDGQGKFWWSAFKKKVLPDGSKLGHRPFLIVIAHAQRVLVQDVTLENSPMFHLVPRGVTDLTIDGITIKAPTKPKQAPNTDGIDPSGSNILITRCVIDTGDDCIAVKPTGASEPGHLSVENVFVTDCHFEHGHGMSVGGQTPGGLRNMLVRDCLFDGTENGIRLKAARGQGGLVENITYENIVMHDVDHPIVVSSYYFDTKGKGGGGSLLQREVTTAATEPSKPITSKTPHWSNILIKNLTADGGKTCGQIVGLAEQPVTNLTLDNVHVTGRTGMYMINIRGLKMIDTTFQASSSGSIYQINVEQNGQVVQDKLPASMPSVADEDTEDDTTPSDKTPAATSPDAAK